jgi:hypothetical protein
MQKTSSHSQPTVGVRIPFGPGTGRIEGSGSVGVRRPFRPGTGRIGGSGADGRFVKYAAMSVTTDGMLATEDGILVRTEGMSPTKGGRPSTSDVTSVTIEGIAFVTADGMLVRTGGMPPTKGGRPSTSDATSVTTEATASVTADERSVTIEGTVVSGPGDGRTNGVNAGKAGEDESVGNEQDYGKNISHMYIPMEGETYLDVSYMARAFSLAKNFRVIDTSTKSLEMR